jgi:putative transposase
MMGQTKNPLYHRRSIRLKGYDYSEAGDYFITLLSFKRKPLFGNVVDGEMKLSPEGCIVSNTWNNLQTRFPQIELEYSVVMPNHFHAILTINDNEDAGIDVRAIHELPLRQPPPINFEKDNTNMMRRRMLLPMVIGYFKMNTAKMINQILSSPGQPVWHRNYYEHIINSDEEYENIAAYIEFNPMNWGSKDEYYQA